MKFTGHSLFFRCRSRRGISRQDASQSKAGRADYSSKARKIRRRPTGPIKCVIFRHMFDQQSNHNLFLGPAQSLRSISDMFHFDVVPSDGESSESDTSGSVVSVGFGNVKAELVMPAIDTSEEAAVDASMESWRYVGQECMTFQDLVFSLPNDLQTMFSPDKPSWAQFLIKCCENLRSTFPSTPSPMRVSTTFAGGNSEIPTASELCIPCDWVSTSELLPDGVHASTVLNGT